MRIMNSISTNRESKETFSFLSFKRFAWILSILMVADIATTKLALSSHLTHEVNGLMASVVQNDLLFIGVKSIGTILILLILNSVIKTNKGWGKVGMGIILTFYTFVFINNLYWIVRYL